MGFLCPYCGLVKDEVERTREHAVPAKMGGNLEIDVCGECNGQAASNVDNPILERDGEVDRGRRCLARSLKPIRAANPGKQVTLWTLSPDAWPRFFAKIALALGGGRIVPRVAVPLRAPALDRRRTAGRRLAVFGGAERLRDWRPRARFLGIKPQVSAA